MKAKLIYLIILLTLSTMHASIASDSENSNDEASTCSYGSHKELYAFFSEKNYIVVAQGKRIQPNGSVKDFADVLFLITPDMDYFHAVILTGITYDHFKACIFSSAREIDYQFAPPIPNLLSRNNREHLVFFNNQSSKDNACANKDNNCISWDNWLSKSKQTFLFSAYKYSTNWRNDPYDEIVELRLDNKVIRPTRGKLSEHARKKYALRLRNELNETKDEVKTTKVAYKEIHDEVDHKLPLIFLALNETRDWSLSEVSREDRSVHSIIHGVEFELYPMTASSYKNFTNSPSP